MTEPLVPPMICGVMMLKHLWKIYKENRNQKYKGRKIFSNWLTILMVSVVNPYLFELTYINTPSYYKSIIGFNPHTESTIMASALGLSLFLLLGGILIFFKLIPIYHQKIQLKYFRFVIGLPWFMFFLVGLIGLILPFLVKSYNGYGFYYWPSIICIILTFPAKSMLVTYGFDMEESLSLEVEDQVPGKRDDTKPDEL